MLKIKSTIVFLFFCVTINAQDVSYAKKIVDTLASKYMAGRGYVENGDKKAANYIKSEFKNLKLKKVKLSYFQNFSFPVNTFPNASLVILVNDTLTEGKHYIFSPSSTSLEYDGELIFINDSVFASNKFIEDLFTGIFYRKILCITTSNTKQLNSVLEEVNSLKFKPAAIILTKKKLTWSVATETKSVALLEIIDSLLPANTKQIKIKLQNQFIAKHKTQNVIAKIKGKSKSDTCIVFTAHYDHLGKMGNAIFPGANDNASGTAMLLSLANYYAKPENKPNYSIIFMAFAGEEAGLIGSKYYTENPLFDLSKIKFLVNLDLMGTGDDGVTVVNATEYKQEFEALQKINSEKKYIKEVKKRGKAANSDHYWFTEKRVPSFFIYANGARMHYHDVYDVRETLPLENFNNLFKLLIDFSNTIQN
ncbi:MAG: M28 family peptidase [Bacteroidota bacterium]